MDPQKKDESRFRAGNLLGVLVFLRRYPGWVALSLSMLLVILGIDLYLPQVIGDAINDLRIAIDLKQPCNPLLYGQLLLWLVLVRTGLAWILGPIRNRAIQSSLNDLRSAIYNAMQRLPFAYHDRANTGELLSRSTTDIFRLQDFFYACLYLTLDITISLVVIIAIVFATSPVLGLIVLGTMIPTMGLMAFYTGKMQPQWRQVHDLHSAMTTVVQENIAGVRVVKAFAKEAAEIQKFCGKKEAFLQKLQTTMDYWAARVPLAQFVFGLSLPLILWVGGRQVIQGQMPIGDLAKVVFYMLAIGHRVGAVGQFTNILQNASASAERVLEVLHEPQVLQSGKRSMPTGRGAVEFENVSFNYRDGKASLEEVSFKAQPGQTIAIVGPTGSGKTTLVNLIPRFYDPAKGRVLVDGVDVRELKLEELRRSVSVIFQETFLFSATVAENIAYGKSDATRAQIEECARAAQAHEFIAELEEGYETVIGERGISLSGGQRQRIAIARAFVMDPRILILDDATASVDSRTERLIQEAMRRLCQGRTSFIIAQRFSTVQHADLILVLNKGRIVEQGRHEELIKRSGFYKDIFERQLARGRSDEANNKGTRKNTNFTKGV